MRKSIDLIVEGLKEDRINESTTYDIKSGKDARYLDAIQKGNVFKTKKATLTILDIKGDNITFEIKSKNSMTGADVHTSPRYVFFTVLEDYAE